MRKYIMNLLFVLVSVVTIAQPATKTEPAGPIFPKGYTKTTSPTSTDESLNQVTVVEIKDEAGILKLRFTYKKDLTNKCTVEKENLTPSGKVECKITYRLDENQKLTGAEIQNDNGKTVKLVISPKGDLTVGGKDYDYDDDIGVSGSTVKRIEAIFQKDFKDIESKKSPSGEFPKSACADPVNGCQPKIEIFAGYSYLNGQFGNERESFPLGGQAIALFNVAPHINTGLNVSHHVKKDGDQTFSRSFIMVEGQYVFGDVNNCDRKLIPDVHVLIGLGSEKFKYDNGSISSESKSNGFAFGAGGGLKLRLNNRIGLGIQADWLGIKFKDTDKLNGNLRGGLGFHVELGKRKPEYSNFPRDNKKSDDKKIEFPLRHNF